ncbi:expressed unknown protein [Seminavis robusta]|uniref:Uncharacterized protein n=1 Tax=Seminavis robusta TaxID=568900 RepID=A0A9N8EME5_9STRA|nr:expressed unknown protein [Seminavis robusta]|eukprot:Sro1467_g275130.1 n/a (189) ;mRNA; r:17728-18294
MCTMDMPSTTCTAGSAGPLSFDRLKRATLGGLKFSLGRSNSFTAAKRNNSNASNSSSKSLDPPPQADALNHSDHGASSSSGRGSRSHQTRRKAQQDAFDALMKDCDTFDIILQDQTTPTQKEPAAPATTATSTATVVPSKTTGGRSHRNRRAQQDAFLNLMKDCDTFAVIQDEAGRVSSGKNKTPRAA